jgi:hypothetical protein
MTLLAKPRIEDPDEVIGVECVFNRERTADVDKDQLFFVLSEDVRKKFDIDYDLGEMLIYSPYFEPALSCMWVAQTIDFDFVEAI